MSGRLRLLWALGLASSLGLLLVAGSWFSRHYPKSTIPSDFPTRLRLLLDACLAGKEDRVSKLLDADTSLLDAEDEDGWTCLINASKTGHTDIVQTLVRRGCRLSASSMHSALRGAALYGHIDVVRLLLRSGHQVDALSEGRKTALMGAAMNGHLEVARLLLRAGADPRLRNDRNETAHDLARFRGHTDVVELIDIATNDIYAIWESKTR